MILVRTNPSTTYAVWDTGWSVQEVVEELTSRLARNGGAGFDVLEVELSRSFRINPSVEVIEDDVL